MRWIKHLISVLLAIFLLILIRNASTVLSIFLIVSCIYYEEFNHIITEKQGIEAEELYLSLANLVVIIIYFAFDINLYFYDMSFYILLIGIILVDICVRHSMMKKIFSTRRRDEKDNKKKDHVD